MEDIGGKAAAYGGIVIPAHVDRPAFSMTSQLGVVVKGPWAAVECTRLPPKRPGVNPQDAAPLDTGYLDTWYLDTLGYPLTTSSDAHYPEHVARRPFELDLTLEELAPHGLSGEADMDALVRALAKRPTFKLCNPQA